MYRYHEEAEFPNWWDALDEAVQEPESPGGETNRDRKDQQDQEYQQESPKERSRPEAVPLPAGDLVDPGEEAMVETSEEVFGESEFEFPNRVSEVETIDYSAPKVRGYEREVVENVWGFAEVVPGNDPDLWRKDEWGNWIRRIDYGRRESEFGWEIFDPGIGRHSQGVYAMRPMQWKRFLEQFEVFG
ncbi:MAG: hypothetical protein AAF491_06615 [Verrucomicrobiota bacterium]